LTCEASQLVHTHFSGLFNAARNEPDLRQATLQRHLTALEADLVESAGSGALTFDAAPAGLALARGMSAAQALGGGAAAATGMQGVQAHLNVLNLQHIADFPNHAAILGRIDDFHRLVPIAQAQTRQTFRMSRRAVIPALEQSQSNFVCLLSHVSPQPRISSTVLPRFAAMS
jgi:hypothetical protein